MSPFKQYHSLLAGASEIACRYLPDAEGKLAQLQSAIASEKIHVMLFGSYNAGKSTLINALVGEEVARVDDVPTTSRIDAYEWDGHVLLDTPGINAPIEHEAVTLNEIRAQAHLVLFVLRQEDQDAKDVFERLLDIIEGNHPVFVLLNYSGDETDLAVLHARFMQTLVHCAAVRGIGEGKLRELPVLMMNVRTAARGRMERKPLLVEHAGFHDFSHRFSQWLRSYDDEHKRLAAVFSMVDRTLLSEVDKHLSDAGASEDDKAVAAQLAALASEERVLRNAATARLRSEIQQRRATLSSAMDEAKTEAEFTARASAVLDDVAGAMRGWLQQEAAAQIKGRVEAALGRPVDPAMFNDLDERSWMRFADPVLDAAGRVGKDSIKQILLLGRELKVPWLKGRWEKTLDKWAGRAAPMIGVAVGVLQTLLAAHQESEENEAARARVIQRSQILDQICADMEAAMGASVTDVLDTWFRQQREPLEARQASLLQKASQVEADRIAWTRLRSQLLDVRF